MKRITISGKKDEQDNSIPYIEKYIAKLVPDINTGFPSCSRTAKQTAITVRAEDLEELLNAQEPNYTVYDGGAGLGSDFISFNQNTRGTVRTHAQLVHTERVPSGP